jgi:putative toxin-antitoxin system antitoxin component (TIGR02293 family)
MVNELAAVVHELGGVPVLRRRFRSDDDMHEAIRQGFPQPVLKEVMESAGLNMEELAEALGVSLRSLQRRKGQGKLAADESDRIYRLARMIALAKHYIGDAAKAGRWIKKPNRALGGKRPIEMLNTEPGARRVEAVLGIIAYGGVA